MPSNYSRIVDNRRGKQKTDEFFYVDERGARPAILVQAPAAHEVLEPRNPSVILVKAAKFADLRLEVQWPSDALVTDPQLKFVTGLLADDTLHVLVYTVTLDLLQGMSQLVIGVEGIPNTRAVQFAMELYMATFLCLREPEPGLRPLDVPDADRPM